MFKKKLAIAAIAAAVGLTAVSCKGNSDTMSIFLYQDKYVYQDGMPVFERANKVAGLELEGFLQKYDSNYKQKFTTGGKDCNIVVLDQDTIESTALSDELYIDITPYITEEIAPNLTKFFNENPEKKHWATSVDGKIYGIPFYTAGKTAKAFFIRLDWCKKLAAAGKLPKGVTLDSLDSLTVDQLHDLLLAFKTNKSLLTTADNIYPYFDRDARFGLGELASFWGGSFIYEVRDGKVVFGAATDDFKVAMQNLSTWYEEGIIEPSILDNLKDKRTTYFGANSGGMTHDWLGSTYGFNDIAAKDTDHKQLPEGFELLCIRPPKRADGTQIERTSRKAIGNVTAINKKNTEEQRIKIMKWIDFFFGEEGNELLNFGVEGEHFTKVDGKNVFTDKILNANATALANLYQVGCQLQTPGCQDFEYEKAWLSESAKKAMESYNPIVDTHANDLIYPNIKFTKADYEVVNKAKTAVEQKMMTYVNQWLKDGSKLTDASWKEYLGALEEAGLSTVTTKLQERYDLATK